jgi:hypothetical protein
MLDKSSLNKILAILIIAISSFSCAKVDIYNSTISCPNGLGVVVRFARKDEVVLAIQKAAFIKKQDGSNENYTIIRLSDRRSFKIEKVPPEDSLQCFVREDFYGRFSRSYVRKYMGKDLWFF